MGFDVAPSGPLARLLVSAMTGRTSTPLPSRGPYVPPSDTGRPGVAIGLGAATVADRCEHLLRCALGVRAFDDVADWLLDDVIIWTPVSYVRGLAEALASTYELGSTLTEVMVRVVLSEVTSSRTFAEWRLSGRFTEPCFVDDDLLLEPTGRLVETAGALVVAFEGDRVASLHCYYDELALLEQLVSRV
jgi:hypothetical protein